MTLLKLMNGILKKYRGLPNIKKKVVSAMLLVSAILPTLQFLGLENQDILSFNKEQKSIFRDSPLTEQASEFGNFLIDNSERTVYIYSCVESNSKIIGSPLTLTGKNSLTLQLKEPEGGGLIVYIENTKLNNGFHCLDGNYEIALAPGMHQGWVEVYLFKKIGV